MSAGKRSTSAIMHAELRQRRLCISRLEKTVPSIYETLRNSSIFCVCDLPLCYNAECRRFVLLVQVMSRSVYIRPSVDAPTRGAADFRHSIND
jgi:hypothetical protein